MNNLVEYFKGAYLEFKDHVEFPKWSELQSSTIVVAVSTLILALFLFGVDEIFLKLVNLVYTNLRNLFQ